MTWALFDSIFTLREFKVATNVATVKYLKLLPAKKSKSCISFHLQVHYAFYNFAKTRFWS